MSSNVRRQDGPSALLPMVSSFSNLSAGSEFDAYKDPQWRFLLTGEDITGYVVLPDDAEGYNNNIVGCVLKVNLDDQTSGFGMVLVDPSQRGKGLAKLVLNSAFGEEKNGVRFVLAVCSLLGQPVYRKMGFQDVGAISMMTCSVSDLWSVPDSGMRCSAHDGKELSEGHRKLLIDLDQKATGFNRESRMKVLLDGYSEGSRSTVAFFSSNGDENTPDAAAVARQDLVGGSFIIGPIMGPDECCLPLMRALIHKHFVSEDDASGIGATVMINGHSGVVQTLLGVKGMKQLWEWPAMSSDGKPVYLNGNGSYLGMMHPTLG